MARGSFHFHSLQFKETDVAGALVLDGSAEMVGECVCGWGLRRILEILWQFLPALSGSKETWLLAQGRVFKHLHNAFFKCRDASRRRQI